MQELVDAGEVADYADLARLAHVSRSRISQIMSLLLLAPDTDRREQRRMWGEMVGPRDSATGDPARRSAD